MSWTSCFSNFTVLVLSMIFLRYYSSAAACGLNTPFEFLWQAGVVSGEGRHSKFSDIQCFDFMAQLQSAAVLDGVNNPVKGILFATKFPTGQRSARSAKPDPQVYVVRRSIGHFAAKYAMNNVNDNDNDKTTRTKRMTTATDPHSSRNDESRQIDGTPSPSSSGSLVAKAVSMALGKNVLSTKNQSSSADFDVEIPKPAHFGAILERNGFLPIPSTARHESGDVAVWSSVPGHEEGHVQVFFRGRWYSGSIQRHLVPWHNKEASVPSFYRYFMSDIPFI